MNKNTIRLVFGFLLLGASVSPEGNTTNKSFISVGGSRDKAARYSLNRYLLEYSEDRTGGCLEASPFMFESERTAELAGALNPKGKQTVTVGTDGDIDLTYVPSGPGTPVALSGSYELRPSYRSAGVHLHWLQRLDGIAEGFYVMLATTVAAVKTNPKLATSGTDAAHIKKYLSGTDDDATNLLTRNYGRINLSALSKTGFADVDLQLGCRFTENEHYYAGFYFISTIPTSTKVTSEYLFGPVLGDNNHCSLGLGVNLERTLASKGNHSLSIFADLEWRYRITNTQERILGIKGVPNAHLMIVDTMSNVNSAKIAASEFLNTNVKVKAGNMLDLMGGFSYTYYNVMFQGGYEFRGFESEFLYLEAGRPFIVNNIADVSVGGVTINSSNLDFDPASSPTRQNHKIFGAFGYIFDKDGDYPVVLGLGGSYNFARSNNCIIEGWGLFAKVSLGF